MFESFLKNLFNWRPAEGPRMSHDLDPGVTTGFHIGPVNIPADEFEIFDPPVKIGIDMQYKNHCFPELSSTKFEIL